MRRWIYGGTFDPITNGHLDVIERACPQADELVVAVVDRPLHKAGGLFETAQRVELARAATAHLPNVSVSAFSGMLVEFARDVEAVGLVRGLRTVSDFEYEFGICHLNRMLSPQLETFYVLADPRWSFCSSSAVRELHALGGDLAPLVPRPVADVLATMRER